MVLWHPIDPGSQQRRLQIAIRWLQVLLYLLFLSYIALSFYFFYNGLVGLSVLPSSGVIAQQFPQAYQASRISSFIAVAFAMAMLITGVLGKIAVKTTSPILLGIVTALQSTVAAVMMGTAVYAHSFVWIDQDVSDPQVPQKDRTAFMQFLARTVITSSALGALTATGMLCSIALIVLLKSKQRMQRNRYSTSDTTELFESADYL